MEIERTLREFLALAQERLDATEDPYKRDRLRHGIRLGGLLLNVLESIRPLAAEQVGQILAAFEQGGMFGGDNGRTHDGFGLQD